MEMLSREYGWTPEEIRRQPAEDIDAYLEIMNERALLEKHNSKKRHG